MKKKMVSLLLAGSMVLPCAVSLTACGGGRQDETISETEWQQMFTTDCFKVGLVGDGFNFPAEMEENYSNLRYDLTYNEDVIQVHNSYDYEDGNPETANAQSEFFTYVKETVAGSAVYKTSEDEPITENEYNAVLADYVTVLEYVRDNQASFTFTSPRYYQFDAQNSEIADELDDILSALHVTTRAYMLTVVNGGMNVGTKAYVLDDLGNIMERGDLYHINFDKSLTNYAWSKVNKELTNCTIKGGTDLDYGEYYFTENAFRVYTPNLEDPTRKDGYFVHDTQTDTYYQYRQDESGAWSKSEISGIIYENAYSQIYDLFFGYIINYGATGFTKDGNVIEQQSSLYFTQTVGGIKYWYQKSKITIDDDKNVVSATWQLRLEMMGQYTPWYDYTLEVGGVELTLPTV